MKDGNDGTNEKNGPEARASGIGANSGQGRTFPKTLPFATPHPNGMTASSRCVARRRSDTTGSQYKNLVTPAGMRVKLG